MYKKAHDEAENFLKNEKQFHLGMLPTEQSNPKTQHLDQKFALNPANGVKMLLMVDRDVQKMAQKVLNSNEFQKLVSTGVNAIMKGKKIVFSGCGSTGRLSILLESMWRHFFRDLSQADPVIFRKVKKIENCIFSIMTGGDYALVRSVENFEDFTEFGKQQVKEMNITSGDVLIAITEGGETSSVLGSVEEAANRGAKIFLLFNNPAPILIKHIERSRRAIEDPRITVLDLYCGPMAIAGSTRMQATTSELLIAGAALENILLRILNQILFQDQKEKLNIQEIDYAEAYNKLLDDLLTVQNTEIIAEYANLEKDIYQKNGLVTYFAENFMLDIFTDTTERAPTFMLPPFKKFDDTASPVSWAFVKNPIRPTPAAWEHLLGRPSRCLEWDNKLYSQMGVPEDFAFTPPQLDKNQILKFLIGNEEDNTRFSKNPNIAVNIVGSGEILSPAFRDYQNAFNHSTLKYEQRYTLIIGNDDTASDFRIACSPISSVLNLMEHMAVKLILNTISTGTMVLMGRVTSNWMSWVEVSNKKLKDRGIRLISEICGLSYKDACYALHESIEELKTINLPNIETFSPVQYTIKKIRN